MTNENIAEELNINIIKELLGELVQEIEIKEGEKKFRITKGKALVKKIINEALGGDKTMIGAILKIVEKIDRSQKDKTKKSERRS